MFRLEKTTAEKKKDSKENTKPQVNTSTHCHQFSLSLSVILVTAGRGTDKKGFNENIIGMKLLSSQFYQDVCVEQQVSCALTHICGFIHNSVCDVFSSPQL